MRFIKTYESFKIEEPKTMSELLENLSVVEQNILDSIKAEPIRIESFFNGNLPTNNLEKLINNSEFNDLLRLKGLTRGNVEQTDDYETFLLTPFKYLLIKSKEKSELHNPDFIILQTFNSTQQDWNKLKMYQIHGDFKNFYDKLTNRTIEIPHDGKNFLYQTSNKNEWELTNQEETEQFPKHLRKEQLLKIISR
tara:strand:- start:23010 stop:23591 length:582 start_codon:yes stop_codon:yes gene_type:complete